jgi:hypothetical protein
VAGLRRRTSGTAGIGMWMPRGFPKSRNEIAAEIRRPACRPAPGSERRPNHPLAVVVGKAAGRRSERNRAPIRCVVAWDPP